MIRLHLKRLSDLYLWLLIEFHTDYILSYWVNERYLRRTNRIKSVILEHRTRYRVFEVFDLIITNFSNIFKKEKAPTILTTTICKINVASEECWWKCWWFSVIFNDVRCPSDISSSRIKNLAANLKERVFTKRKEKKTETRKKNNKGKKLSKKRLMFRKRWWLYGCYTIHFLLFPSSDFSSAKIRQVDAPPNLTSLMRKLNGPILRKCAVSDRSETICSRIIKLFSFSLFLLGVTVSFNRNDQVKLVVWDLFYCALKSFFVLVSLLFIITKIISVV